MSCPILTSYIDVPFKKMLDTARKTFPRSELQIPNDYPLHLKKRIIAEMLYYHKGSKLAAEQRWNDMTRLHLEHELTKRGRLEAGEVLSDWKLKLRMAGVDLEERRNSGKTDRVWQEDLDVHENRSEDEGYGSSEQC
jgi:hypothetical protein